MDTLKFTTLVLDFYKNNKRHFPWRETTNPYFIFISEICLQQTQTSRVIEKYNEIVLTFPTVDHLAKAEFSTVLSAWSGLGYNRRAKYLWESAKIITEKYNSIIPSDVLLLDQLPGVGINTACAIAVYAFNRPHVFIETNIRRVFIHHFFKDKAEITDKEILPLIEKTLDAKNPREWYWALMDYGSHLPKIVTNPNRKSAHYTKQSTFRGSVREVRGSILRVLLSEKKIAVSQLAQKISGDKQHFELALSQLEKEHFVRRIDGDITLQ